MKFLCDEMLGRLGRWLRAAGYDTLIITGSLSDREVMDIALTQDRWLITRDRHFLQIKEGKDLVVWLHSNHMDDLALELSEKKDINWMYRPFSRCMLCNGVLSIAKEKDLFQVPEGVVLRGEEVTFCPACRKSYWQGSHTGRMLEKFKQWDELRKNRH